MKQHPVMAAAVVLSLSGGGAGTHAMAGSSGAHPDAACSVGWTVASKWACFGFRVVCAAHGGTVEAPDPDESTWVCTETRRRSWPESIHSGFVVASSDTTLLGVRTDSDRVSARASLRAMAGDVIYAYRIMRLPLLDAGGSPIGRIDDIVTVPGRPGKPPRVVGFVASSQRRRIFVNSARIADLDGDGVRLRSWDLDLNPFKQRPGETLLGVDIINRAIGTGERVSDVGLVEQDGRDRGWRVDQIRLARRSSLRRRPTYRLAAWNEVPDLFAPPTEMAAEAARLRDMHKSDVAQIIRSMPLERRRQLAAAMDDERLADVLEELPEAEQLRIVEALDLDRMISVLEEMELDDLADLLGEMPVHQRAAVLQAMDDDDAEVVTRLLSYEEATAGGMMTPEVVILGPTSTVAEALAQLRDPKLTPSIASQVFVVQPPFKPPTGRYLGTVFMQRLLREPPALELRQCLATDVPTIPPETPDRAVFEEFASYDMLATAVVDEGGRLHGAVSVDDVVDRMLGSGWRLRHRRQDRALDGEAAS